jgi:hypothetical protein
MKRGEGLHAMVHDRPAKQKKKGISELQYPLASYIQ